MSNEILPLILQLALSGILARKLFGGAWTWQLHPAGFCSSTVNGDPEAGGQKHQPESLSHRKEISSWWLKNPSFGPTKTQRFQVQQIYVFRNCPEKHLHRSYLSWIIFGGSLKRCWVMPTSYKPIVWRVDATAILKKVILVPGKSWYLHV